MPNGPDPTATQPNPALPGIRFLQPSIRRPNIVVGAYTYYAGDPAEFEANVTHHYAFLGDALRIGRFCAIARGVEFVMNGANHRMNAASTYPFHMMGGGWEVAMPGAADLPFKGDTVVGNDVWIGQNATILPGVRIGDGAIVGARAVVARDVPAYAIVAGNPARVVRMRFDAGTVERLLRLRWWDWSAERITANLDRIAGGDVEGLLAAGAD